MSITRPRAGNLLPLTNAVPERCFKPAEFLITREPKMRKLMWLRAMLSIPNLLARCGDLISGWNTKPEGKKIRGNSWVLTHGLKSAANQAWAYFPFELTVMDVSQPDNFQSPPERLKSLPCSDSSPYNKILEVRQNHAVPTKQGQNQFLSCLFQPPAPTDMRWSARFCIQER